MDRRWQSNLADGNSPNDEHQSSGPRPVKFCLDQLIFQFLFRYTKCISKINSSIWLGTVNSNVHFEDYGNKCGLVL